MMGTRWGLMLPLVHHQCNRQSDVRTSAFYSMRNQVFNRDSQGPSFQRGKAGTHHGDGMLVFVQVQEKKTIAVLILMRTPCPHEGRKMKEYVKIWTIGVKVIRELIRDIVYYCINITLAEVKVTRTKSIGNLIVNDIKINLSGHEYLECKHK